ncbi:chemotaxis protein CheB [Pseudonocardia sp. T1-2H]|uniref:chemotaxis protein CheB n=1 Tax=Pseudonocardia sp. T1-2H TaxID=3128899 RepID=UPI003101464B
MTVARRDLIVVGASAGGVEALRAMVAGLPADLPAAVLVVLHLKAGGTSALGTILDRSGPLPAAAAKHRAELAPGTITVARPDHHLLVADGITVLSHGPTESGHRPAIDALFRSAARAYGHRTIGVQLSGVLDDGAAGMVAIAAAGGTVVVQEPTDALYPAMPEAVLRFLQPDHLVPAHELGPLLGTLAKEDVVPAGPGRVSELDEAEVAIAMNGDSGTGRDLAAFGEVAGYSCPDCDGALVALRDTERCRCRVGHAWTAEALLDAQHDKLERALWTAYRLLEEKSSFARRMQQSAAESRIPAMERRHAGTAREAAESAEVLRELLLSGLPPRRVVMPDGDGAS